MAEKSGLRYFYNSSAKMDGITIPTSDFDTDSLDLSTFNRTWMIEVIRSQSDGTVSFTIEGSMDGTNWSVYDDRSENVSISGSSDLIQFIIDSELLFNYVRISFSSSGSPTGTLTARFYSLI